MRTTSLLAPLTLLFAAVALAGCAEGGGGGSGNVSSASGDSSSGAGLFASYCSGCHGGDAQGGSGPSIAGISDSAEVVDIILYGGRFDAGVRRLPE